MGETLKDEELKNKYDLPKPVSIDILNINKEQEITFGHTSELKNYFSKIKL